MLYYVYYLFYGMYLYDKHKELAYYHLDNFLYLVQNRQRITYNLFNIVSRCRGYLVYNNYI